MLTPGLAVFLAANLVSRRTEGQSLYIVLAGFFIRLSHVFIVRFYVTTITYTVKFLYKDRTNKNTILYIDLSFH